MPLPAPRIMRLAGAAFPWDERTVLKAGIVPFAQASPPVVLLCKPCMFKPELGEPPFQIAKGTRMHRRADSAWQDMREGEAAYGDAEPLWQTALREAREELGVPPQAVTELWDAGYFPFRSASTGRERALALYLLPVERPDALALLAPEDPKIERCAWLAPDECAISARSDHAEILARALAMTKKV